MDFVLQDLAPRAYVITPIHSNAVIFTYSFSDGAVSLNNALPVPNATGKISAPAFTYFHSFNFFGRTANLTASLPYGIGHFQGTVMENEDKPYRSGLRTPVRQQRSGLEEQAQKSEWRLPVSAQAEGAALFRFS